MLFLLAQLAPAYALGTGPSPSASLRAGLLTARPVEEEGGSGIASDFSRPLSLRGNLQMALSNRAVLKVGAFAYSGKRSLFAFQGPALGAGLAWSSLLPATATGLVGRAPTLSRDRANGDQAYSYSVDYSSSRLQLSGSIMDVGARFSPSADAAGQSGEELESIKKALGSQAANLKLAWQLSPLASFTSERKSVRTDKPGDEKNGLTAVDMVHAVAFNLSAASKLTASIADHDERWDPGLGKADLQRRTSRAEFQSQFGGGHGDLRLALTSVNTRTGDQSGSQTTREWHLNLQPHSKLHFSADNVAQDSGQGQGQTTNTVAAVLALAQDSQLSATMKNTATAQGAQTRESNLQFTGALGHGASAFSLTAVRNAVRSDANGILGTTKLSLTGGFGQGPARTNLSAKLEQQRSSNPTGPLAGTTVFHADRAFGPRLRVSGDHERKLTGTSETAQETRKSAVTIAARLGPRTEMTANINAQSQNGVADRWARDLVLEQAVGPARLRLERHLLQIGGDTQENIRHGVEIPIGSLPEWAKNVTRAHQFEDVYDYMTPKEAGWLEAPVSGLRLWTRRWQGGADGGRTTLSVSQGRVIGRRYYAQYTYQRFPEGTEGDKKDRPLDVLRQAMVFATPVRAKVTGRCWFARERGLLGAQSERRTVGLGLWGQLSDQEQVEASVSHDSGTWEGAERNRTSVSLLYSLRVSEEHKVSLKLGYAWGECLPGTSAPEYRATVGYDKPM